MAVRGILERPIVLHTRNGAIVVYPAGCQVAVESNDDWQHDVQDADMKEAVDICVVDEGV